MKARDGTRHQFLGRDNDHSLRKPHPHHLRPGTPRLNPNRPRPLRQPPHENPPPRLPHLSKIPRPLLQQTKTHKKHLAPHPTHRPLLRAEQNLHHREPLRAHQTPQPRISSESHPGDSRIGDADGIRRVIFT